MKDRVKRFIGKVLPDGHLSLPDETAKEVGSVFDVVLMPVEDTEFTALLNLLQKRRGSLVLPKTMLKKLSMNRGVSGLIR